MPTPEQRSPVAANGSPSSWITSKPDFRQIQYITGRGRLQVFGRLQCCNLYDGPVAFVDRRGSSAFALVTKSEGMTDGDRVPVGISSAAKAVLLLAAGCTGGEPPQSSGASVSATAAGLWLCDLRRSADGLRRVPDEPTRRARRPDRDPHRAKRDGNRSPSSGRRKTVFGCFCGFYRRITAGDALFFLSAAQTAGLTPVRVGSII